MRWEITHVLQYDFSMLDTQAQKLGITIFTKIFGLAYSFFLDERCG